MTEPVIEVLSFAGCPHGQPAFELVERLVGELGLDTTIRRIDVPDAEAAVEQRFLGSPSVRVDGRDVEPGADQRGEYALSCRVYQTDSGLTGQPDERWLRAALLGTA